MWSVKTCKQAMNKDCVQVSEDIERAVKKGCVQVSEDIERDVKKGCVRSVKT